MGTKKENIKTKTLGWLSIPAFVLLFLLFLIPLCLTLSNAVYSAEGGFSFSSLFSTFTSPYTLHVLGFTLYQALLSTLASVLVGLPGAYILANYNFTGKRLVKAVSTVPFVLPSILVVLGFVIFYGNNGILNRFLMKLFNLSNPPLHILYSFKAIILAHAFFNFPIIMNLVSTYWEHMDYHCEQAAQTLGADSWKTFWNITFPRLLPSILSACTLVFLFCYNSFAIIMVLGGGPQFTTMEVEIYRRARVSMDNQAAATISIMSLLVTCLLLVLYTHLQKASVQREQFTSGNIKSKKTVQGFWSKFLIFLYSIACALFVLGPLTSVIVRSFMASSSRSGALQFSLKWYRQLFGLVKGTGNMGSALSALQHSMAIALLVALISIPTSLTLATALKRKGFWSSALELLGMLPMAVSSVVIGLGYYLISSRIHSSGYIMVVLAHLIIAIPFALRSVVPEYRKIPPNYLQAAHTLGADELRIFLTIEAPLLKNSLLTGAMFAFALSLGELNATLTLSNSNIVTLPVIMYQLIGSYNYQGACALGTILIVISVTVFLLSEYLKGKENG